MDGVQSDEQESYDACTAANNCYIEDQARIQSSASSTRDSASLCNVDVFMEAWMPDLLWT